MAIIDKKLIHFINLATFEQRLNAGDIKDTSIVFIQDAKRIWTHGLYYSSPYTKEEIDQLFVGSNVTLDGYLKDGVAEIVATDTVNSAFGKVEDYLDSLSDLNAILVDTGVSVEDTTSNDNILSGREIKDIKNKYTEKLIYPRTHAKAVTVGIDTSLEDSLEILNKINNTIKTDGDGTQFLSNDGTYKEVITEFTETDPTVPAWAKAENKPTYTASEVGAQDVLVSGINIKTINGLSVLGSGDIEVAAEALKFSNLSASTWIDDSTYVNFGYRCDLPCPGVTADMYAEVVFNVAQATSGRYAPICETSTDIVSIWASVDNTITIPAIIITK